MQVYELVNRIPLLQNRYILLREENDIWLQSCQNYVVIGGGNEEKCKLRDQKSAYCLTVVLPAVFMSTVFGNTRISAFIHRPVFRNTLYHSVNINASRTFQQFSQISCTIINKPVNMHKSRPNVFGILMTATQVSLPWLLMHLNVVFFYRNTSFVLFHLFDLRSMKKCLSFLWGIYL